MSPEDAGEFGRYCHYRRSEDSLCTRLRLNLTEDEGQEYEQAYLRSQEARAA